MKLTDKFKHKTLKALEMDRMHYSGSDSAFAKKHGINASVFSRMKNGIINGVLGESNWLSIGRSLGVTMRDDNWKIARTEVYNQIEDNLKFCKEFSKAMILVDTWGIGKTASAKHILRTMDDAFYLDCSQAKTKMLFIKSLAKSIGVEDKGRYVDVKEDLKYYLNLLERPIVVLDDAGDLQYDAFLALKELWNGTEDRCGWYMIGDDSLQAKISKGLEKQKVGYGAIFSRFSGDFIHLVPIDKGQKLDFMSKLVGDVATANTSKTKVNKLIKQCVSKEKTLRHLKTLIQLQA